MSPQATVSPPIERRLDTLAPIFREPFEGWLTAAQTRVTHVTFRVTETRRTLERQQHLYAQGRQPPFEKSPVVTWTLESRHRWGIAADFVMIRNDTKEPIWGGSSYEWLYRLVPPEHFGLAHLGSVGDWLHLELFYADAAVRDAGVLGLTQT